MNFKSNLIKEIPLNISILFPEMNQNVKGELRLEDDGNNLVLNFTSIDSNMGRFNFRDEFNEVLLPCHGLYFRIPGDFQYDNSSLHPMSLQVRCHDFNTGQEGTHIAMIDIPVEVTKENEKQSKFFEQLNEIVTKNITLKNLPYEITIKEWGDLLDILFIYDEVNYYSGRMNFPPCEDLAFWFSSKRALKVTQKLIDQLLLCMDPKKCPHGNHRETVEMKDASEVRHYTHY